MLIIDEGTVTGRRDRMELDYDYAPWDWNAARRCYRQALVTTIGTAKGPAPPQNVAERHHLFTEVVLSEEAVRPR